MSTLVLNHINKYIDHCVRDKCTEHGNGCIDKIYEGCLARMLGCRCELLAVNPKVA